MAPPRPRDCNTNQCTRSRALVLFEGRPICIKPPQLRWSSHSGSATTLHLPPTLTITPLISTACTQNWTGVSGDLTEAEVPPCPRPQLEGKMDR